MEDLNLLESFDDIRSQNIMVLKESKEQGKKVVGIYCTYGPREIVLAAGAIPVGLCGTRETPIPAAERDLPRNLCPLIKSSYGYAITDTCPYFHFSDLILGETTCDGKKKMFELMQKIKPVHIMQLPNTNDSAGLQLWYQEMKRFKERMEEELAVTISDDDLRDAIKVVNEGNRALKDLHDLNKNCPAVISGMDLLKVSWQIGFHTDRWERVKMLDRLVEDLKEKYARGESFGDSNTPRILLTGTPVGLGSEKVVALVEECGGAVVAMESCGGYKTLGLRIDEEDSRDPLLLIAEKYLQIPCSVMTPNKERFELLREMVREFKIDGVIDLSWQACHTYAIEAHSIGEMVKNELELPYLYLESDYSNSDRETLRVRIEAFLEMV